jgi:hypothetical protein
MRKLLATLLALFVLVAPSWALVPKLAGAEKTLFTASEDLSNASATVVSATTGRTISVFKYALLIDAADTVTLLCGSTVIGKYEFTAAGGVIVDVYPMAISCAVSEALTVTKGTAANDLYWQVWYEKEVD